MEAQWNFSRRLGFGRSHSRSIRLFARCRALHLSRRCSRCWFGGGTCLLNMARKRRVEEEEEEEEDDMDYDEDDDDDEEIVDMTKPAPRKVPGRLAARSVEPTQEAPAQGRFSQQKADHASWFVRMACGKKEFSIKLDGNTTTKTYGAVGGPHETVVATHDDNHAANVLVKRLLDLKEANGYKITEQKIGAAKGAASSASSMVVDEEATAGDDDATDDDVYAYLEFVDGKSSKFWQIKIDGSSTVGSWGKIGTAGQSQTKSWASPAAARDFAEKQTQSKISSGYVLLRGTKKSQSAAKPAGKATAAASKAAAAAPAASKAAAPKAGSGKKDVLGGLAFAISGTLSIERNAFRDLILANGGSFLSSVTKKVHYVIATEDEVAEATIKIASARKLNIMILSEDFITDSIAAGELKKPADYALE